MTRKLIILLIYIISLSTFAQKSTELNGIHTTYNKYRRLSKIGYWEKSRLMMGVSLTYDDSSALIHRINLYDNDIMDQVIFDRDTFEADKLKLLKQGKKFEIEIVNQKQTIKEEKDKNFLYLIISVAIGILLIITIISFLNIRRQKKKIQIQNDLINQQKTKLEDQKTEIVDSINYSKRIQSAILPETQEINDNFSQVFVIYKPKDIVSGDFYYFSKIGKYKYIAVADCTGHGVPGAFMSLIGSKELRIANSQSNSPSEILKILNNGVKETLKQNQLEGTKDGMDIALLRIDNNNVTFSGANRPLWLVKMGSNEITEIKATKTAIAGFTPDNQKFEEHNLNLSTGDCLYIFSDGYADQFGGDKQKKMTTKRFKEVLLSIYSLPMTDQQKALEKHIADWQGELEQVDDVLVIGIRI